MKLAWLEGFVVFAEELNFTRAAERLFLTQPALHVQIKKLGQDLGLELYRRAGRDLELTPEGRRVEVFARDLLDRISAFGHRVRSERDETAPVLAAGRGTLAYLLADKLKDWVDGGERPLSLRTGDRESVLEEVLSGRAHVGVVPVDGVVEGLVQHPLHSVNRVAIVPERHGLAHRTRVSIGVLGREPMILPPRDRPHRTEVESALRKALGHAPEVALEVSGWDLMMRFAALGIGVAIVNDFCVPPPGTRAIPVTGLQPLVFSLVEREGSTLPPWPDELRDHLMARKRPTRR